MMLLIRADGFFSIPSNTGIIFFGIPGFGIFCVKKGHTVKKNSILNPWSIWFYYDVTCVFLRASKQLISTRYKLPRSKNGEWTFFFFVHRYVSAFRYTASNRHWNQYRTIIRFQCPYSQYDILLRNRTVSFFSLAIIIMYGGAARRWVLPTKILGLITNICGGGGVDAANRARTRV